MQTRVPSRRSVTFAVPVTTDEYAPEVLYLNSNNAALSGMDAVDEVQGYLSALPAGAQLEMDQLKGDNPDPRLDASWNLNVGDAATAIGPFGLLKLGGWVGVRFRAKSGGTAGDAVLDLSWTRY